MRGVKMKVTIRGVAYPTQVAAANALDVDPGTIHRAHKYGTLDTVGLGNKDPVPIQIGRHKFPSLSKAAKACGLSISGVVHHLDRGTLESLTKYLPK